MSPLKLMSKSRFIVGFILFMVLVVVLVIYQPAAAGGRNLSGIIAYKTVAGTQLRTILPDGAADTPVWTVPDPNINVIVDLNWHPQGDALAFTSNHEVTCSIFANDIYTIKPNGQHLRRVTNSPLCGQLAGFPQGSVKVTVSNPFPDSTVQFVFIQGAPDSKFINIPPFSSKEVIFDNVADFGAGVEQLVTTTDASNYSWDPSVNADVLPGQLVDAGNVTLAITPFGNLGPLEVSWSPDGGQIGFTFYNGGLLESIPVNSVPGQIGELMTTPTATFGSDIEWSPSGQQALYADNINNGIFVVEIGSAGPGEQIVFAGTPALFYGVDWLPDESGIVFAASDGEFFEEYANIYVYTFADKQVRMLTNYDAHFTTGPSVSPDGQYVVYSIEDLADNSHELRVAAIDGSEDFSLGVAGYEPDWGVVASVPDDVFMFLPFITGR